MGQINRWVRVGKKNKKEVKAKIATIHNIDRWDKEKGRLLGALADRKFKRAPPWIPFYITIIPAATVLLDNSSIKMKLPVFRFLR